MNAQQKPSKSPSPASDSRRGVALLIVIGLLAVLLIMGVAFSVYMRIERSGSANYRHGTGARHLLQAALARAADTIDIAATNIYPIFYPTADQIPAGAPFRNHILVSEGTGIDAQVLSIEAMKYVPEKMRRAVRTANPQWQAITDSSGAAIGRCAFIVINTSGLLDANEVGGAERDMGRSPAEIQLLPALLPELQNANSFTNNRDQTHGTYHTMAELHDLAVGMNPDALTHFETFSRFTDPEPRVDAPQKTLIQYPINNEQALLDALREAGVARGVPNGPTLREFALMALNNYMSPGLAPPPGLQVASAYGFDDPLQQPNTKPVPMTYEFCVAHNSENLADIDYSKDPDQATVDFHYWIKFMYPVDYSSGDYEATMRVYYFPEGDCNVPMPGSGGTIGEQGYAIHEWEIADVSTSFRYPTAIDTQTVTFDVPDGWTPQLHYKVIVRVEVRLKNGTVVDRVPGFDWNLDANTPDPGNLNKFGDLVLTVNSMNNQFMPFAACLDPRFNFFADISTAPFWQIREDMAIDDFGNEDRNDPNFYTRDFFDNPEKFGMEDMFRYWPDYLSADSTEDKERMACSDPERTGLKTLGELGLIPMFPWITIPLFDREEEEGIELGTLKDRARVYEYFTLKEEEDRSPVPGRVNINTVFTNVLASVFVDMPLYEWERTEGDMLRLDSEGAHDLAALLIRHGPYDAVADLGRTPRSEIADIIGEGSDFAVEAVLRNAFDLLGWRQQLFTVIMRADAFAPAFGSTGIERGSVLSTGHAIAQIWRDPLPDPDNDDHHPMFVRFFKPLGE